MRDLDDEQLDAQISEATIITESRVQRALIQRRNVIHLSGFRARQHIRAITPQGELARWRCSRATDDIALYRAPLVRLLQFRRQTADGVWHDLEIDEFELMRGPCPRLRRKGDAWPEAVCVCVEIVSGYAISPEDLPEPMGLAVLHQLESQLLDRAGRDPAWYRVRQLVASVNWNDLP